MFIYVLSRFQVSKDFTMQVLNFVVHTRKIKVKDHLRGICPYMHHYNIYTVT